MMQKRFLYLWFPRLTVDRAAARHTPPDGTPFGVTRSDHNGVFLCGLNAQASTAGLHVGMRLTDARALVPGLVTCPAQEKADHRLLLEVARFADRFSPWIARDGPSPLTGDGGLWLDMTGGAHLFGGEKGLLAQVREDMQPFGVTLRLGMADSAGAAWAVARCGQKVQRLEAGQTRDGVAAYPLYALRLERETIQVLNRLGLRIIGDLYPIPRANMANRFGPEVMQRLDQCLGRAPETLDYLLPPRVREGIRQYAEPLANPETIAVDVQGLLDELCVPLKRDGMGLRRLSALFERVDNSRFLFTITTGSPSNDPVHLFRLMAEKLPGVDAGFGLQTIRLRAGQVQAIRMVQHALGGAAERAVDQAERQALLDRIRLRLGARSVFRLARQQSHLPERLGVRVAETFQGGSRDHPLPARPLRLLSPPEPVEVLDVARHDVPLRISWRRIPLTAICVSGPERITREWWRKLDHAPWSVRIGERDYYRFDDGKGHRLWLCRMSEARGTHRWYVHGLFG